VKAISNVSCVSGSLARRGMCLDYDRCTNAFCHWGSHSKQTWWSHRSSRSSIEFRGRRLLKRVPRRYSFHLPLLRFRPGSKRDAASVRHGKCSTTVKAKTSGPHQLHPHHPPRPGLDSSCSEESSPHRRGRGRGGSRRRLTGTQRKTLGAVRGRQVRWTWGPIRRLQLTGPLATPAGTISRAACVGARKVIRSTVWLERVNG
jgi:hypothetical protein